MRWRAVLLARPLAHTPYFRCRSMVCIALPFFRGFNQMAEIDGGYVLLHNGAVVSMLRLEIAGLMTARSAEAFTENLDRIQVEMNQMEWLGNIRTTNPENPRRSGAGADMARRSLASDERDNRPGRAGPAVSFRKH